MTRPAKPSAYVCANCGVPVRLFTYGWKHCKGRDGPPGCGNKPEPVLSSKGKL